MPVFKYDDWFSQNEGLITRHTQHLRDKTFEMIEIGCFEGRSTLWFFKHFPKVKIHCVDSFNGGEEHGGINFGIVRANFMLNLSDAPIVLEADKSESFFKHHPWNNFEMAFVDGSHRSNDVLRDLIGCYDRLKVDGLIFADDYLWQGFPDEPHRNPKLAIDSFIACFKDKVEVLEIEYGVALKKIA